MATNSAVADLSCINRLLDRFYDPIEHFVFNGSLQFNLDSENAPHTQHRVTTLRALCLPAEALDFGDCEAFHAKGRIRLHAPRRA